MLRVTLADDTSDGIPLMVEGKLVGEWVEEFGRLTDVILREGKALRLDLSAVTFVDDAGAALIKRLELLGARVTACSLYVETLIRSVGTSD